MGIVYLRYWGSHLKRPRQSYSASALMNSIVKAGWTAYLVCSHPPEDPSLEKEITDAGAKILYLPRQRKNFDLACIRNVYTLCKQLKCDIMHCDNMHTSPLIGAWLAGVPVRLWSKRSMNQVYETMRKPTLKDKISISTRISCMMASKVLPVSSAVKNELVSLGIHPSKLHVLLNSVQKTLTNKEIRNNIRKELGFKDDEIVFSTIGHAVPVKGWDILLKSFATVFRKCPKVRLLYIGSYSDKHEQDCYNDLNNSIHEWDLINCVTFLGYQSNLQKAFAATDVFVIPSRSEGYCKAIVEAMTFGLPCISTKVGVAEDIIVNGENGLLVERGNEVELSQAMISMADDEKLRFKITKAVQEQEKYALTPAEYGEQLVELYKDLLNKSV